MTIPTPLPGSVISAILRHDRKVTSYKIALVRAINDVVLAFPDMLTEEQPIAIPLRMLAASWVGYFWPFADPDAPIRQGAQFTRAEGRSQDIAFRAPLEVLRRAWEAATGSAAQAADGFFLVAELRTPRRAASYPRAVHTAYARAVRKIVQTMEQPIEYAGPPGQHWAVFPHPVPYHEVQASTAAVPGTLPADRCLILSAALWATFRELSLWVEALCVHEWCLLTERFTQDPGRQVERGDVYQLLTERPENRRPLTWERNSIEILLLEGAVFQCPWTKKTIGKGDPYDLDHIVPIAVTPINELWNLVPADPDFNQRTKRDQLPSTARLDEAREHFATTYGYYHRSLRLTDVLRDDVALRFRGLASTDSDFPTALAGRVVDLVNHIAVFRNLARF